MKTILAALTAAVLAGCSSSLEVYDSSGKEAPGIPINSPELVRVVVETKYVPAEGSDEYAGYCKNETNQRFEFMPLGDRHYIDFDPAMFGDGEFVVNFNDKGLLTSVTLNSQASLGMEQADKLLSTALPFLKEREAEPAALAAENGGETPAELKAKHCQKTGEEVRIEPVEYRG